MTDIRDEFVEKADVAMATGTELLTLILAELRQINAKVLPPLFCQHGDPGLCMLCIQPTLNGIEMAVRSR